MLITAREVKVGTTLDTYMGKRTVIEIRKNLGANKDILNYLYFDNGQAMANEEHLTYRCVFQPEQKEPVKVKTDNDYGRYNTIDWILAGR
jgi:hypothetical protein